MSKDEVLDGEVVDGSSMELAPVTDTEALVSVLTGVGEVQTLDTGETQASIIRQILNAETAEAAMADAAIFSTEDLVGIPFEVTRVRIARSRFGKDGKGGFLVCDITKLDDGTEGILTTSSAKPAARILWFATHDALPAKFKVREPVVTGQGYKVYDVESA